MEGIDYSLADGGAVAGWLRKRGRLSRVHTSVAFRVLFFVAITWLPLLVLTVSEGVATGDSVQFPFFLDFIQHARFLVALPFAIWAEAYISPRYESILARFPKARIVSDDDVPRFKKLVSRASSLKDSIPMEIALLVLVYAYIALGLERDHSQARSSWMAFGFAAKWYLWVSMPVFLFFWFRWLWRHLVWAYLLLGISRLNLRLIATHPDSAAGLTFISLGHRRYSLLVFSISAILCASIGERIVLEGQQLRSFELELTTFFLICLAIVLGPLMAFTPVLIRAKLRDIGKYGVLSASYTRGFDEKWIQGRRASEERLIGNPDIQSLSDMQNSYRGVANMRTILPDRKTVVILFIAYALPALPLLTTIIPLRQILTEIFKLLSGIT